MTEAEKEWYAAREAAEYLGIPLHRLARLRREGRIKSIGSHRDPVYHISELKKADTRDLRRKENAEVSEGVEGCGPSVLFQHRTSGPIYRSHKIPVGA